MHHICRDTDTRLIPGVLAILFYTSNKLSLPTDLKMQTADTNYQRLPCMSKLRLNLMQALHKAPLDNQISAANQLMSGLFPADLFRLVGCLRRWQSIGSNMTTIQATTNPLYIHSSSHH